jgi:DNA (cytosine-5)-methyltransferase 1
MKVLAECYHLESRVLNCVHWGVPQQRKRLIVVGVRKDISTCGALHPAPSHVTPVPVAEAFAVSQPALGALLTGKVLRLCEARYAMQQLGQMPKQWRGSNRALDVSKAATAVTTNAHKPAYAYARRQATRVVSYSFTRLSIEQAAWLMRFPARYMFTGPVNARFRQVGNAVPPPLGWAVAMRLHALLFLDTD